MDEQEIKEFIKEHLKLEVKVNRGGYEEATWVTVGLRFDDDEYPFTDESFAV